MWTCTDCQKENKEDLRYCSNCKFPKKIPKNEESTEVTGGVRSLIGKINSQLTKTSINTQTVPLKEKSKFEDKRVYGRPWSYVKQGDLNKEVVSENDAKENPSKTLPVTRSSVHGLAWSYVKQGDLNQEVMSENDAKEDPPKALPLKKPLDNFDPRSHSLSPSAELVPTKGTQVPVPVDGRASSYRLVTQGDLNQGIVSENDAKKDPPKTLPVTRSSVHGLAWSYVKQGDLNKEVVSENDAKEDPPKTLPLKKALDNFDPRSHSLSPSAELVPTKGTQVPVPVDGRASSYRLVTQGDLNQGIVSENDAKKDPPKTLPVTRSSVHGLAWSYVKQGDLNKEVVSENDAKEDPTKTLPLKKALDNFDPRSHSLSPSAELVPTKGTQVPVPVHGRASSYGLVTQGDLNQGVVSENDAKEDPPKTLPVTRSSVHGLAWSYVKQGDLNKEVVSEKDAKEDPPKALPLKKPLDNFDPRSHSLSPSAELVPTKGTQVPVPVHGRASSYGLVTQGDLDQGVVSENDAKEDPPKTLPVTRSSVHGLAWSYVKQGDLNKEVVSEKDAKEDPPKTLPLKKPLDNFDPRSHSISLSAEVVPTNRGKVPVPVYGRPWSYVKQGDLNQEVVSENDAKEDPPKTLPVTGSSVHGRPWSYVKQGDLKQEVMSENDAKEDPPKTLPVTGSSVHGRPWSYVKQGDLNKEVMSENDAKEDPPKTLSLKKPLVHGLAWSYVKQDDLNQEVVSENEAKEDLPKTLPVTRSSVHGLAWSNVKQGDLNQGVMSENDAKEDPPKTLPLKKPLDNFDSRSHSISPSAEVVPTKGAQVPVPVHGRASSYGLVTQGDLNQGVVSENDAKKDPPKTLPLKKPSVHGRPWSYLKQGDLNQEVMSENEAKEDPPKTLPLKKPLVHGLAWSYVKQGDLNKEVVSEKDAKEDPPKALPLKKPLDVDYYGGKANEMRIILLGKSGGGKSATANTILGSKEFDSKVSGTSITSKCKFAIGKQFDRNFVLVDTPGLFDTGKTNEMVTSEIVKCIGMTSPGPHAFLLVVTIGRFTKEERDTVQHFVNYFGEDLYKYLIVVFTRKDDLDAENTTIEEYIKMVPDCLKKILQLCEQRYIAFNNRLQGDKSKKQVQSLIDKIDDMVKSNGNRYFTNDVYDEAEKAMRNRHDKLKRELDEKKNREIEAMRNTFGKKIEIDAAKSEETRKTNEIIKPTKPVTSTPLKQQFTERSSKTLEREVSDLKKELISTRGRSDVLTEIMIKAEEIFNKMEKKAAEENNKIEAGKNELAKKRELLKYEKAEYEMNAEDNIKRRVTAQLEKERLDKTLEHKEQEMNKKMIKMEPEGQNAEKDEQKFLQSERVADKEKELITRVKEGSLKAKSVREKIEMNKKIIETRNAIRNDDTKALESEIFELKKELISARDRSASNSDIAIRIEEVLKAMEYKLSEDKSKIQREKKKLEQERQLLEEEREKFEMEIAMNEIKLIAQLEEKRREIEMKYEIEEKQIRDTIRKEVEEYETTGTFAKDETAGTFAKDEKTGTFAKIVGSIIEFFR